MAGVSWLTSAVNSDRKNSTGFGFNALVAKPSRKQRNAEGGAAGVVASAVSGISKVSARSDFQPR